MKVLAHAVARGSLILLIALIATACVSQDARIAKAQKHTDQTSAVLAQMTDADSLAAAGLLSIGENQYLSLAFLVRATDAAPDRADLYWLRAMRCSELPHCDPTPIEQHLRELDPMNGAGWWVAMTRAGTTHDSQGMDAALTAISHSERVDIYWTTLIAHLTRAVANTKKMSLQESEVAIIGYLAALAVPPYQYVSTSCKGERLQQPGVTETCRGIARAFQHGDTYLTEMMGVTIAKRVWPEESPEWKAAVEQRRVYEYRSTLFVKLSDRLTNNPDEYLTLCGQNRRESDLFAAQLIAAGYDPNPPAK
jgi:hypothetical protein